MGVVVLEAVADPAQNVLSPKSLSSDLERLATDALAAQANALVVLRQVTAAGLSDANLATNVIYSRISSGATRNTTSTACYLTPFATSRVRERRSS